MKQPINNRRTGRNKHNMETLNINIDSRNYDDLILPPDAEGEEKTVYDAIIRTNGLSGTEKIFSVPQNSNNSSTVLKQYLQNFCGENVCVAFWNQTGSKFEKCGVLSDVGADYLSIKEHKTRRLTIMNIEKIKYISVFCV